MKLVRVAVAVALIGLLGACGASKGDEGAAGAPGKSCSVATNDDGTYTIACEDGTTVTLHDGKDGKDGIDGQDGTNGQDGVNGANGQDGAGCTVADNGDGSKTITCGESTVQVWDGLDGTNGTDGTNGADGTSCTVTDDGQGTKTITCGADSVTVKDGTNGTNGTDGTNGTNGVDGTSCAMVDNQDGTYTITCGETVVTLHDGTNGTNGTNGTDGASCAVVDNDNGTYTVTCGATEVTLSDGTDGTNGTDGTSCTVGDKVAGCVTVTCGTANATVCDGTNGTNGSSCSVTDNGSGVKTIACTDGSTATVSDGQDGAAGLDGVGCTVVDNGNGTKTITCANGFVTVADGAKGASGASAFNVNVEIPAAFVVTVTKVTMAPQAVIEFKVADAFGRGAVGLKCTSSSSTSNLRFALEKLVPANATTGEPADWVAYVRSTTSGGPTADRGGVLVDNGDGTYKYTTLYNKVTTGVAPLDYVDTATTRLVIQLSGTSAAGALPYMNAIYDFVPSTGVAPAAADNHNVVTTAACNECHGGFAFHGSRTETGYCGNCHVDSLVADGSLDFAYMVHAIHGGEVRGAAHPYAIGTASFAEVTYPQNPALCKKCHDSATSAQGGNWAAFPTKGNCSSCHAAIDFTNHPGAGDVQADNSNCKLCHSVNGITAAHKIENNSTHATGVLTGAYNFTYEVKSVTVDASGYPTIVFKIGCTKDGVVCNTAALPIDLKSSPADLVFGPSFLLAHASSATAADYDNLGYTLSGTATTNTQPLTVSLANIKDGTKGTLSDPDASGYYTAVLTGTNTFPANTYLRTVALQGYFSQSGVAGVTGNLGRHTVAALKTVTGDTARRTVVDSAKCGNCHEWFEGHGGNRVYTVDVCATCHVPNLSSSGRQADPATVIARLLLAGGTQWDLNFNGVCDITTDPLTNEDVNGDAACNVLDAMVAAGYDPTNPLTYPEESMNLKDMIHAIHEGEARGEEAKFRFVRDRGTSGVFYYDMSEVTYPQSEPSNCLACHKTGTYDADLPAGVSDSVQATVGASWPSDTRTEILAARKTTPNATDWVSTPTAATCAGCHTSELAAIHIEQNGGALSTARGTITEVETCSLCHGVGKTADVTVIHPAFQ